MSDTFVANSQIVTALCSQNPVGLTEEQLLLLLQNLFPDSGWSSETLTTLLDLGARYGTFISDGISSGDGSISYQWRLALDMLRLNPPKNTAFQLTCPKIAHTLPSIMSALEKVQRAILSLGGTSSDLSESIIEQLENIGDTTIGPEQWQFVGSLDQGISTSDSVTFTALTADQITYSSLDPQPVVSQTATTLTGTGTFPITESTVITLADFATKTITLPDLSQGYQYVIDIVAEGVKIGTGNGQLTTQCLAVDSTYVYISGNFTSLSDGTVRNSLARFELATGALDLDWNPNCNGEVVCIAIDATNSLLYIGGIFTTVKAVARNRIARISTTPGSDGSPDLLWDPDSDNTVRTIAVDVAGSLVYAGGDFANIGGAARARAARLSAAAGAADGWDPSPDARVDVIALDVANSNVYVGGIFANIGGAARARIARLSTTVPGNADGWDPSANAGVIGITLDITNSHVYLSGGFTIVGGQIRVGIGRVLTTTGAADSWDPSTNGSGASQVLVDGELVYVCGVFSSLGGQPRQRFGRVSRAAPGLVDYWHPNVGVAQGNCMVLNPNGGIFLGGNFGSVQGVLANDFVLSGDIQVRTFDSSQSIQGTATFTGVYCAQQHTRLIGMSNNRWGISTDSAVTSV